MQPQFHSYLEGAQLDGQSHSSKVDGPAKIPKPDPRAATLPSSTSLASLSTHKRNRIRLLNFPAKDIANVRQVIKEFYPSSWSKEKVYGVSYQFKLHGSPWGSWALWHKTGKDFLYSVITIREIMAYLFKQGWIIQPSTNFSSKPSDKHSLAFSKSETPLRERDWLAISFYGPKQIQLVGADQVLAEQIMNLFRDKNVLKTENLSHDAPSQAWTIPLRGSPWRSWRSGKSVMNTHLLVLNMLEVLKKNGWSLYASLDQHTSYTRTSIGSYGQNGVYGPPGYGPYSTGTRISSADSGITDAWYCFREKGWSPGSTDITNEAPVRQTVDDDHEHEGT